MRHTSQNISDSLARHSNVNWFMLAIAGVIAGFGILVTVPPLVNPALVPYWAWATPHMTIVVFLTWSLFVLIGLWHHKQYITTVRKNLEAMHVELERNGKQDSTRLCALLDVTRMMADDGGLESVVDHITETCGDVFECDRVSIMFFNAATDMLVVRAVGGRHANHSLVGAQLKLGKGIAGWAAERREALLLSRGCNLTDYPGLELNSPNTAAAMVVPIILDQSLVGVINVSTESVGIDYDEDDFRALQVFAENVGACIRNAQTHDHMKQTIRDLKNSLKTIPQKGTALAVAEHDE